MREKGRLKRKVPFSWSQQCWAAYSCQLSRLVIWKRAVLIAKTSSKHSFYGPYILLPLAVELLPYPAREGTILWVYMLCYTSADDWGWDMWNAIRLSGRAWWTLINDGISWMKLLSWHTVESILHLHSSTWLLVILMQLCYAMKSWSYPCSKPLLILSASVISFQSLPPRISILISELCLSNKSATVVFSHKVNLPAWSFRNCTSLKHLHVRATMILALFFVTTSLHLIIEM